MYRHISGWRARGEPAESPEKGEVTVAKSGHRAWGTVRKRDSGRWQASYIGPDGQRHTAYTTYADKLAAEGWLAHERRLIEREREEWTSPAERMRAENVEQAAGITFGDYSTKWLQTRTVKGRPLARRTSEHYETLLVRHIYPEFETTPLRDIDMTMVDQWYARTLTGAPTMRSHTYSLFKTILETARTRDRLIETNPCMIRGAGTVTRAGVTVVATVDQLVAVVEAMPEDLRLMVLLAGWTALRAGELVELRRGDIELTDDEVGVIRVRRGAARVQGGEWIIAGPKTNAGVRDVDIPPHIIPAVREHLKRFTAPVETVIPLLTTMARAYTRGNGFDGNEPNSEIEVAITTAAARLAANASQLSHATNVGPLAQDLRGGFTGWSVAELTVLNRYRVRAR